MGTDFEVGAAEGLVLFHVEVEFEDIMFPITQPMQIRLRRASPPDSTQNQQYHQLSCPSPCPQWSEPSGKSNTHKKAIQIQRGSSSSFDDFFEVGHAHTFGEGGHLGGRGGGGGEGSFVPELWKWGLGEGGIGGRGGVSRGKLCGFARSEEM